ncbi:MULTISPECIES: YkgJ family cysteine cluster protein [unclassified Pseudomonas]|uniref:YkgJ family cysteine cluster protein n=1 Tax=unclassified Pseudomonas TaxID=196821 RepID=UPI0019410791|nr:MULTISPECIES: YkgJ family cysteine cluster protein [unclassified Pseudomonas]MCE0916116.1 YkgJ family cysteine cluster protein [Pseudomonas sp. NMI760_13]MCP8636379.1 YkgJ family cysteine cluster protein [Pseudomonas sp. DVZ6]MDD7782659.1 YkgJ family cysteine cluster protein [Pseudomonas sp. DVZ24]BCJ06110.1 zinc/iron-chelating domain-containing protein [Pseudomonas sp. RtIB026]
MKCREGCGACCIAPSISSPIPGMPQGKPAGERCLHLNVENLCALFGRPERPQVCGGFKAEADICGNDRDEAIRIIGWLEQMTAA